MYFWIVAKNTDLHEAKKGSDPTGLWREKRDCFISVKSVKRTSHTFAAYYREVGRNFRRIFVGGGKGNRHKLNSIV